jgi:hypothetical protein
LIRPGGFRVIGRFEKFTSEPRGPVKEQILVVWPENDISWGFTWGRSGKLMVARVFFTDTRLVMVGLVSILSPGFAGTTMAVQVAELERKRQNERMRTATLDSLLASDAKNMQIGYDQVNELCYDKKGFKIKFGGSTVKVQPVKSGGFLGYAHPDAVSDPAQLVRQTIEILNGVPSIAGKIVAKP